MIAGQTTFNTRIQNLVVSVRINRPRLAAIGAAFGRLTRTLVAWMSVPTLPYATLWEASLVADLVNDRTRYEARPLATDLPRLTDSWLRV